MRPMGKIERLARRLCWLGFSASGRRGKTEASYWAALPLETHSRYIDEAQHLLWQMRVLEGDASSRAILSKARSPA